MKTVLDVPYFPAMRRQPQRKSRTVRAPSQKSGRFVYPSLDEFLSMNPVASMSEYGAKVISGRRIC